MKKYLKLAISALLVLTLSIAPNTVTVPAAKTVLSSNTGTSITEKLTEVKDEEIVTVDSRNAEELSDENDTFYEPEKESITVVDEKTAFINDAITVFFTDEASDEEKRDVIESVGGEIVGEADFLNQYEVKIKHSELEEITSLCDELMANENVEFATCTPMTDVQPNSIPDDPWTGYPDWDDDVLNSWYRPSNWWIKAIDADKAWDYQDKMSHIKIGLVDSGFDTEHEELKGKITFPSKFFEKHNAPDDHGTHVAGIIAAERDNGIGISGIVKDCELVCVDWHAQKEQKQYWISDLRIMSGFISVVRAGAKVVNFSLGSSSTIANGTVDRFRIIKDIEAQYTSYVVAKLIQAGYEFICCQSAGNGVDMKDGSSYAVDASNNGFFCTVTQKNAVKFVIGVKPQDILDRIIIVSSAQFNGYNTYVHSSFSNGGEQVSISAPGSYIYSLDYKEDTVESDYGYKSGTSMAAPVVTGVAALVWSINPDFTSAQVKHFVCDTENTKYTVEDNTDETHLPTGSVPMVNAQLAVEAALRAIGDPDVLQKDDEDLPDEPEISEDEATTVPEESITDVVQTEKPFESIEKTEISKRGFGLFSVDTKRIADIFRIGLVK